jgi:hypothetical protein
MKLEIWASATSADGMTDMRLLPRSATGLHITICVTFITRPDKPRRQLHYLR